MESSWCNLAPWNPKSLFSWPWKKFMGFSTHFHGIFMKRRFVVGARFSSRGLQKWYNSKVLTVSKWWLCGVITEFHFFAGFLEKENSLETLIVIFKNVSPKGFFWMNMKNFLQTAALKPLDYAMLSCFQSRHDALLSFCLNSPALLLSSIGHHLACIPVKEAFVIPLSSPWYQLIGPVPLSPTTYIVATVSSFKLGYFDVVMAMQWG